MASNSLLQKQITAHVTKLKKCSLCPKMISPVVTGRPVVSPVMLIGQAPGPKEGFFGQPFAWTAGKTMFKWFSSIGIEEEDFRNRAFMAAVCRCFPGKNPKGGDRVPDDKEIANCSRWLNEEIDLLKPKLIITVGKLAICQFLEVSTLDKIIGRKLEIKRGNLDIDLIPLPHPSGASTWHRMEPGQTLLKKALNLLKHHEAWQSLL